AIAAFFVLAYIHVVFSRTPTNCLEHIKNDWPREGILRVEILRNGGDDYNIEKSYAKEEKLRHENVGDLTSVLGILARDGFVNIEPSSVDEVTQEHNGVSEASVHNSSLDDKIVSTEVSSGILPVEEESTKVRISNVTENVPASSSTVWDGSIPESSQFVNTNETTQEDETLTGGKMITPLKESVSEVEKLVRAVWPEEEYIVEYSLEYGFLRLSPGTRQRLNIPVKIVTLDPNKDSCFGDAFSRFILDEFLGYDDLLMASIKTLAEQEDNKGYLRNVVTGEHYRFVSMWMARTSYLAAFFIMLVFVVLQMEKFAIVKMRGQIVS
ncbi:hypothetical protein L9F63_024102, partial [Diploptera punctata]